MPDAVKTPSPTNATISFNRQGHDYVMRAEQWLPASPEIIWDFVSDCRHMNHVIPPFVRFEVLSVPEGAGPPQLGRGVTYEYKLHLHGIGFFWRTLIDEVDRPHRFVDLQAKGPYARFSHEHLFDPVDGGTLTRDILRYRPPGGPLAGLVDTLLVKRDLRRLFLRRHQRMAELFADGESPAARLLSPGSPAAA